MRAKEDEAVAVGRRRAGDESEEQFGAEGPIRKDVRFRNGGWQTMRWRRGRME
jgi:hypothetical protein